MISGSNDVSFDYFVVKFNGVRVMSCIIVRTVAQKPSTKYVTTIDQVAVCHGHFTMDRHEKRLTSIQIQPGDEWIDI
jgi:hypothetical protein